MTLPCVPFPRFLREIISFRFRSIFAIAFHERCERESTSGPGAVARGAAGARRRGPRELAGIHRRAVPLLGSACVSVHLV